MLSEVKAIAVRGFVAALQQFVRTDSWMNPFSGFGTARDRTASTVFSPSPALDPMQLAALFDGDDMARRIVSKLPSEMTRLPFSMVCARDSDARALDGELSRRHTLTAAKEALTWGRLFGGCVIYPGAVDGRAEWMPLDLRLVGRVAERLEIFDARYALPFDMSYDPQIGPLVYRLRSIQSGVERVVHRSRLLITRGAETDALGRLGLNSWDNSVLQACYEPLRQFNQAHKAGEVMLSDASTGVLKIKGFIDMIAEGRTADLHTRAQLFDLNRSVAKALMLDADGEDFTKQATSFASVPEMIDRFQKRLAAAAEMPVTILMGQAPAGLNATGDADVRLWYDSIKSEQEHRLRPLLLRLGSMIAAANRTPPPLDVTFTSLWQETPKDVAEREELESRADQIYIMQRVRTNADVARRRFGAEIPVQAPPELPAAPTASSTLPQLPTGTSAPRV